jgi:hypothetical protein
MEMELKNEVGTCTHLLCGATDTTMLINAPFPLTLTLSPGEREHASNVGIRTRAIEDITTLKLIHPLPEGEGRGEGEAGV